MLHDPTLSAAGAEADRATAGRPPVVPFPGGVFDVVYADPAWNFKSNSLAKPGRNARRHYPTMSLAEIAALPVREHVADNAVLFFWITGPFLVTGAHLPIFKAWGFKPTAMGFTWMKLNKNAPTLFFTRDDLFMSGGFTTRKNAEFCVLGRRGRSLRHSKSVREAVLEPRREHSRKPDSVIEGIERYVGPDKRMLELFARSERTGWTSWGNETDRYPAAPLSPVPVYPQTSTPLPKMVYPAVLAC
jgi:N6-adenosine-specific RNA methylase IME4